MPRNHDETVKAGSKGGLKTKQRLKDDPDYYHRTGKLGGEATKRKGAGWFKFIREAQTQGRKVTYQDYLDELEKGTVQ